MPTYTCTHTRGTTLPPFVHTHTADAACFLGGEDSSCPPQHPLQSCVAAPAAGGGLTTGQIVVGVVVVVVVVGLFWWLSDERAKRDIELVSRRADGIGLYRYRYVGSDAVHVGVLAQEVAAIVPAAVRLCDDGWLRVDYVRLGIAPPDNAPVDVAA